MSRDTRVTVLMKTAWPSQMIEATRVLNEVLGRAFFGAVGALAAVRLGRLECPEKLVALLCKRLRGLGVTVEVMR